MFTGIIQAQGKIVAIKNGAREGSISIQLPGKMKLKKGGSIAVNGVCLTAREISGNKVICDCMPETFRLTDLGDLKTGETVNLEEPLKPTTFLGGHIVQGHVDGTGMIVSIRQEGNSRIARIRTPKKLSKYFIKKGSVCVDGVSLTIVDIFSNGFSVHLIPETLKVTTLGRKRKGASVNIEVDLIAKYIEKFINAKRAKSPPPNGDAVPDLPVKMGMSE